MLVIPAIDLKDGRCVRLKQGAFADQTIYSENPVAVAREFERCGASRLHIVDLDGAQTGESKNAETVRQIIDACRLPVQLGGGIRSLENVRFWLKAGVDAVIVGTLAVREPDTFRQALSEFGGRVTLAVDARDGEVMVAGWQEGTKTSATALALRFKKDGLSRLLYTDISRDGMFAGPNVEQTRLVAETTGLKVTASGGVSSARDLQQLAELAPFGVDSAVVGKAFYEKKLNPEEIFRAG